MITGTLPESLFSITALQVLQVHGNQITGSIQSDIAKLQNLQDLQLGTSNMMGDIPEELYQLTRLQILDLSYAQFEGTLSSSIGFLRDSLKRLILNDNQFYGPIPQELGQLQVIGKFIFGELEHEIVCFPSSFIT